MLHIPWTAKRTNVDRLLEVGGRQLHGTLITRKLHHFGHVMRKPEENSEKTIIPVQLMVKDAL